MREVVHAAKRNPLSDVDKILQMVGLSMSDIITTYANFVDDWVYGVCGWQGSNFALHQYQLYPPSCKSSI